MKALNYKYTLRACFFGYVIQAMVNNFVPLLFVFFGTEYGISLSQTAFLVTANFTVQLLVDLASAVIVDKIGYRVSMIMAHLFVAVGFGCLMALPDISGEPFWGLVASVMIYAVGGGLLEVLVSPIVEACPTDNKNSVMSMLHSFYCWGHVAVVIISTAFFGICGIENWRFPAVLWIACTLFNGIMFFFVPVYSLVDEKEEGIPFRKLVTDRVFWILILMMMCAGASELSVSQWSSAFAEEGLKVKKMVGDIAGPMFFAVMMGSARVMYSKLADKIRIEKAMVLSTVLCVISYLIISLSPVPLFALAGCGICGFSVGIMWPGTFSIASGIMRRGGTTLFALLALAGDLGCGGGPYLVGRLADITGRGLGAGIFAASVFPVGMFAGVFLLMKLHRPGKISNESRQNLAKGAHIDKL